MTIKQIINLTQHQATADQKMAGVVDLEGVRLEALKNLLTFEELPSKEEIKSRAKAIAAIAYSAAECPSCGCNGDHCGAMIGGAGYLIPSLTEELKLLGFNVVQAFTKREVVETTSPDGGIVKTAVFRHVGFVEC